MREHCLKNYKTGDSRPRQPAYDLGLPNMTRLAGEEYELAASQQPASVTDQIQQHNEDIISNKSHDPLQPSIEINTHPRQHPGLGP